jgi:hypothetical protein
MNAEQFYRAIFWANWCIVGVQLSVGLWFVAGPQAALGVAVRLIKDE